MSHKQVTPELLKKFISTLLTRQGMTPESATESLRNLLFVYAEPINLAQHMSKKLAERLRKNCIIRIDYDEGEIVLYSKCRCFYQKITVMLFMKGNKVVKSYVSRVTKH